MTGLYRLTARLTALLILLSGIIFAQDVAAQTHVWDGYSIMKPEGAGTTGDPYIINSGATLKWLQQNSDEWNKVYKQQGDIDLGNWYLGIIGTGYHANASADLNHPFTGSYDGDGYAIKNLLINLDTRNSTTETSFGLFGYVKGGKIRNLMLDGVTTQVHTVGSGDLDLKIGCVAGAVSPDGSVIENVIVKNAHLSDNGIDIHPSSLFVGGVVGDIAISLGGSDWMTAGAITLRNLHVIDADFDFSHTGRTLHPIYPSSQSMQFNVGGMLGRARRAQLAMLPDYTYFSGRIKAPIGSVSPTWGMVRANGMDRYEDIHKAYAGENVTAYGNYQTLDSSTQPSLKSHRLYSGYSIYDSDTDTYVAFTDSEPDGCGASLYGTRTLGTQTTYDATKLSDDLNYTKPSIWRQWQGVGHATYVEPTSVNSSVSAMYNTYIGGRTDLLQWTYNDTDGVIFTPAVSIERTGYGEFRATVSRCKGFGEYEIIWSSRKDNGDTGTGATLSLTAEGTSTFVPDGCADLYKEVTATLVRRGSILPAVAVGRYDIADPALRVVRITDLGFKAYVKADFATDGYRYDWYRVDGGVATLMAAGTETEEVAHYNFANESELPDEVKVLLYAPDGTPIMKSAAPSEQICYTVPVSDIDEGNLAAYSIGIEKRTVGTQTLLVAEIFDTADRQTAGGYDEDYIYEPDVAYKWKVSTDGITYTEFASDPKESWIDYDSEKFYQVTWYYKGTAQQSARYGRNLIFVYDKTKTAEGKTKSLTTFDNNIYPDGNDGNDGATPSTAVRTLGRAYELCRDTDDPRENLIIIMGYYQGDNYDDKYLDYADGSRWNKAATLTGEYGAVSDGALALYGDGGKPATLYRSTIFENINLCAYQPAMGEEVHAESSKHLYLYCNMHDLEIGENVRMTGYRRTNESHNLGLLHTDGSPLVNIVAGVHDADNPTVPAVRDNAVEGVTTITIRSGYYARVLAGARNTDYAGACRVFGTPDAPCRTNIEIDIDNKGINPEGYVCDIGMLVGGQTDGSLYADQKITIRKGYIGRFISGSISYGRKSPGKPADSFFGSIELNLTGGTIDELYGGSLGRFGGAANSEDYVSPYFYGRSIININGATVNSDLYGAGSGGIAGVGNDDYHTDDIYIPYTDGTLRYGNYAESKGKVASVILRDGTPLNLAETYTEINVLKGTVSGNIYGAGCGYSSSLPYERARSRTGNLYGRCTVRVTGGTVERNIYGGGAGSRTYYDQDPTHNDIFKSLANVYGNTNVEISGGTVLGDVFAGAKGIEDFETMANIYGNTNITVTGGKTDGNIYGGCDFASVRHSDAAGTKDGDTHVSIESGEIGNNIFGGNQGAETMAGRTRVEGSTYIEINGGNYKAERYMSDGVTLRTFNTYGGGYRNCTVGNSTNVTIHQSLLTDRRSIGPDADFEDFWADLTHRRFCLYGGGYGKDTDVRETAHVLIDIQADADVGPDDGKNFYKGKQIFDVAGGGYNGWVTNTEITIDGNACLRKVIGGGYYGSVRGDARTTVRKGLIETVVGGCLMGYVFNKVHLTIGTRSGSETSNNRLWIKGNVYGGNDVQGIVGARVSSIKVGDERIMYDALTESQRNTMSDDPNVLYQADVEPSNRKGVYMNVYGGHIYGNVYGAGNGHYRGYYVPGWGRYMEGPDCFYRKVPSRTSISTEDKIYKTRPTVGRVSMNIQGNSESDHVQIDGMVFGGGRNCTIGQWIPEMDPGDPRRLNVKNGGELNMNFGSHVYVGGNVYMGSQGKLFGKQTTVPDGTDYTQALTPGTDIVSNELLDPLGECAYDHWYYDSEAETYRLGFGTKGKMYRNPFGDTTGQNPQDPGHSYFLCGEHQFYGFLKFIEMAASLNLTFRDDPWEAGEMKKAPEPESRETLFGATDISFDSFFLGGERGFMTYENTEGATAFAYDLFLPAGLTIRNKVVGGCQESRIRYYGYKNDYKAIDYETPLYDQQGGLSVQSVFSADPDAAFPDVNPTTLEAEITHNIDRDLTDPDYALRLMVFAQFDPQTDESVIGDGLKRFGGLVYGGCYESGVSMGDVVLYVGSNVLGNITPQDDLLNLKYNVGRVYGAGYGKDSEVRGNTYVYLVNNFQGVNVFGGGHEGSVTGRTNVAYLGNINSHVYGTIYGGSLRSDVGDMHDSDFGSTVKLLSGNVNRVFGGSCLGNVYGGTYVYIGNNLANPLVPLRHIDSDYIRNATWGQARLIAGQVFGGNDMGGTITPKDPTSTAVTIEMEEKPEALFGTQIDNPGKANNYTGFPLVGTLFVGSNADYGTHNNATGKYATGSEVEVATGVKTETITVDLEGEAIPDVATARINIKGGTLADLFGGGNRSTVTESTQLTIAFADTLSRAGFGAEQDTTLIWKMLGMEKTEQFRNLLRTHLKDNNVFKTQIMRTFGGNNKADMAIQPAWSLDKGHLGKVYSGGNFGRMTYYNPTPGVGETKGLSITVNSADIHIDEIYGGGRVGDIVAEEHKAEQIFEGANYGATVKIEDGLIEAVYGGNDVAGRVHNGTNVQVSGAISGDVYGAGNGNYLYKYDTDGVISTITEDYTTEGKQYFILPAKAEYGGAAANAAQTILAINSYRPNVDRVRLDIEGTDANHVWVKGSVFCGGNSSTITKKHEGDDVVFKIGSHVTLNKVYLGSNGESLADGLNIKAMEELNAVDFTAANEWAETELYPTVLDLYMRAVEVTSPPNEFVCENTITDARIGDFFVGGSHGSMMTDQKIELTFPETLTIYRSIVGGCNAANVTYKTVTHTGGLTKPLKDGGGDTKVHLTVQSRFQPMSVEFSPYPGIAPVVRNNNLVDSSGNPATSSTTPSYYPEGQCNIYGGCYNSGRTVGDIHIDLYSDMLDYARKGANTSWDDETEWKDCMEAIVNTVNDKSKRTFYVVGGGYGIDTEVQGNINVRMLPRKAAGMADGRHASAAGIFGGALMGSVRGNTLVEVRDGQILTNIYGASESAILEGSSVVMVGYPDYYVTKEKGKYPLNRADNLTKISTTPTLNKNHDGSQVVVKEICLKKDEIIAKNVYDMISATDKGSKFDLVEYRPGDVAAGVTWNDIDISIGDPSSRETMGATFFGHGNIYGGGFSPNNSIVTLTGKNTVVKDAEGYGGNSSVLVWDNPENANLTMGSDGSEIKDHITIGTCRYVHMTVKLNQDLMDLYKKVGDAMEHIYSGYATEADVLAQNFYQIDTDGGIYGGGRTVYVEGFKTIDLGYYGYADYAPQKPKLINTFQRADLLTVRDCCLKLHGASDFATNKVDNTQYSINRVGELRMVSSIDPGHTADYVNDGNNSGTTMYVHTTPRQRNFIGFYRNVHALAALVSDVPFEAYYHNSEGEAQNTESFLKHKHDVIKNRHNALDAEAEMKFKKRNVGTAANMVGISNGYCLRIQGIYSTPMDDDPEGEDFNDNYYYGPVFGVTEIKLLTLGEGEGGGYIYALNHHYDPDYDSQAVRDEYGTDPQDFLFTTGNFVFPGATYTVGLSSDIAYNYIVDDCMPIGTGYDVHVANGATDVNLYGEGEKGSETHYWYVEGNRYTFNLNITGYTNDSETKPKSFYLDNYDDLVLLPGLSTNSDIKVESVIWSHHPEIPGYECDLINQGKNYNLFLTLDRETELARKDSPDFSKAFIIELPRDDYKKGADADISNQMTSSSTVNPNDIGTQLAYSAHAPNSLKFVAEGNLAAVGLRLRDAVNNRLSEQPASVGEQYWKDHLADPHLVHVVLKAQEKGLHGENVGEDFTYTLNITIDYLLGPRINGNPVIENCALPGEYIYANSNGVDINMDGTNMAITDRSWYLYPTLADGSLSHEGIRINDMKLNDREVAIPAYYYQNGWNIRYAVKANGEIMETDVNPAAEHPELTVHNYHRMFAHDNTTQYDLKPVKGARIYIEDRTDFEYFLSYIAALQTASAETLKDGKQTNPQYAEGLEFHLMADIDMSDEPTVPSGMSLPSLSRGGTFKGVLHGNGHTLTLRPADTALPIVNEGCIYNLGIVSTRNNNDVCVVANANGYIENSYYFNENGVGRLANGGSLVNCYQNAPSGINGLTQESEESFSTGRVAYNLNGFFLKRRAGLLETGATNTATSLETQDDMDDNHGAESVAVIPYIENMYSNGDYLYANYAPDDRYSLALRTAPSPNYHDYLTVHLTNVGNGAAASHHDALHPTDGDRWSDTDQRYHPLLKLADYTFFGQVLTATPDMMPSAYSADKRVYRVSGFYGSKIDRGAYVNREMWLHSPSLTAVDFTGVRDREGDKSNVSVFYPPVIDPWLEDEKVSLDINDGVTRNILVYGRDESIYNGLHYTMASGITDHGMALYDDSAVRAHHIVVGPTDDCRMYGGADANMVLVDKENFNAPIGFGYSELWYNRQPLGFADGTESKSAWEGIYLPFTVKRVFGASTSDQPERDHGELSHFYGDDETLHEYWLRRMVTYEKDAADMRAFFERPTAANETSAGEDCTGTLAFTNNYFGTAYGDYEYVDSHNQYKAEHSFGNYRFLSAGVPYIVAFPGEKYREFDMSGKFFTDIKDISEGQQTVCYIAEHDGNVDVTDNLKRPAYGDGYVKFCGTFGKFAVPDGGKYYVVDEYDEYEPDPDKAKGDRFVEAASGDTIMPFRTYIYANFDSHAIKIGSRGVDMSVEDDDMQSSDVFNNIEVTVDDGYLVVKSTFECSLPVYTVSGMFVREINVKAGINRYSGFASGLYIVHRTKVRLSR